MARHRGFETYELLSTSQIGKHPMGLQLTSFAGAETRGEQELALERGVPGPNIVLGTSFAIPGHGATAESGQQTATSAGGISRLLPIGVLEGITDTG